MDTNSDRETRASYYVSKTAFRVESHKIAMLEVICGRMKDLDLSKKDLRKKLGWKKKRLRKFFDCRCKVKEYIKVSSVIGIDFKVT
jgi:hypothetical protein